jgi:hypothetical protein
MQTYLVDSIRVQLRDTRGATVAVISVPADARRIEHQGRVYRRGGGGSAVNSDAVRLIFHEEPNQVLDEELPPEAHRRGTPIPPRECADDDEVRSCASDLPNLPLGDCEAEYRPDYEGSPL